MPSYQRSSALRLLLVLCTLKQYEIAREVRMDPARLSKIAVGACDATREERQRIADFMGLPEERIFAPVDLLNVIGVPHD